MSEALAGQPLERLRNLDYTVIYARDMAAMRHFYGNVLGFAIDRDLGAGWVDYRVGVNRLALSERHMTPDDPPVPHGAAALQLAFKVERADVDACARALMSKGVALLQGPTDQPWGHRTLFFRDPDGNVVEIFADI